MISKRGIVSNWERTTSNVIIEPQKVRSCFRVADRGEEAMAWRGNGIEDQAIYSNNLQREFVSWSWRTSTPSRRNVKYTYAVGCGAVVVHRLAFNGHVECQWSTMKIIGADGITLYVASVLQKTWTWLIMNESHCSRWVTLCFCWRGKLPSVLQSTLRCRCRFRIFKTWHAGGKGFRIGMLDLKTEDRKGARITTTTSESYWCKASCMSYRTVFSTNLIGLEVVVVNLLYWKKVTSGNGGKHLKIPIAMSTAYWLYQTWSRQSLYRSDPIWYFLHSLTLQGDVESTKRVE